MTTRTRAPKTALSFQSTAFEVIDRDGESWLRGPQIGDALGYQKDGRIAIDKLYKSNADEFTDHMTAVIELPTAGGVQKVRIFSLRGAHLLGMLAKTERAKAFRQWVLDILEGVEPAHEVGRLTYGMCLQYLKERRTLLHELGGCTAQGLASELYVNLAHVSRPLAVVPLPLDQLAPGLRQKGLPLDGGSLPRSPA